MAGKKQDKKEKKERSTTGLSTGEEVEVQIRGGSGPQPIAEMKTWEREGELTTEQLLDLTPADNLNAIGATQDNLFRIMYSKTKAKETKLIKVNKYSDGKITETEVKKFHLENDGLQYTAARDLLEFHAPKSKINLTINLHKHMEVSDARSDESKERIRSKLQIES